MIFVNTGGGATIEPGDEVSKNMLLTCDLNALDTNNDGETDIENFDLISSLDINKVGYMIEDSKINIDDAKNLPEYINISEVNGGGVNVDTGESFETRSGEVIGNWNFETSINAKKLVEDIKMYKVNKEITIKDKDLDIDVIIEEVRVSPTKIKIKRSFKVNRDVESNVDEFPKFLDFIVQDENGNEIEARGGLDLSVDENLIQNNPFEEGELSRDMKTIKIIPVIDNCGKKFNSTKKFEKEAITLELK